MSKSIENKKAKEGILSLDVDDIRNLETLARLNVSDESRDGLVYEVSSIVVYISQIDDLDMGAVDNSTMIHSHKNVTRADEIVSATAASKKVILDDAPLTDNGFIKVTQVIKK